MSPRKRRISVVEDPVEYPFFITFREKERRNNNKRKRDSQEEESMVQIQNSPFLPTGAFKTHDTMDVSYTVEPGKIWPSMTRYNSFILNGVKYYNEDFIFVANKSTIERQQVAASLGKDEPTKQSADDWVARILEIRAADEYHVYARVYWMYWPEELPHGTLDGKKMVQGRQLYHGQKELIASNHMDIINVVSVTMPATVVQWIELDDDKIQDALYWRQAFDFCNSQLSSVDILCKCETPANPDRMIVGCTSTACGKWIYKECLNYDVLMRVYGQLGTGKSHQTKATIIKEKQSDYKAACPLNPKNGEEKETQSVIDARYGEAYNNSLVKKVEGGISRPSEAPTPGPITSNTDAQAKPTAKKSRKRKGADCKLYEGLFKATLNLSDCPTTWEIQDLRENVLGGDETWSEQVYCLFCGVTIN
ncbi:hypothetical protein BGZ61DRAFT_465711 [Ilyonectria robusta]|uniref:uncharacterized protein n=1 Tax=Ilyonectria robusta TaxID=1079257 RepID=UPI001E8CE6C5|nr:uncharacterized protein BGZ61DRAFT_465711 [Ilyonectria robusta]KAH8658920.1 hypothetical protein BGZ61DRAFT_465711 [Ilyonectria robusta]